MDKLSLNNSAHNHQDLQIATRNESDVSELLTHQHVSDDISEEPKESPIKRRYTKIRDLQAVSQNHIISEPSQGVRIKSSLKIESNSALI